MVRILSCALIALLLSACASPPPTPPDRTALFDDQAFDGARAPVSAGQVFAMTPAMQRYLKEQITPTARLRGQQEGLIEALYSNRQLRLTYDSEFTRNASEAFEARAGNCLSLVILTASFAKAMGLEVRYQRVNTDEMWFRQGDLVQVIGHVNVSIGRRGGTGLQSASQAIDWLTVDFLPLEDAQRLRMQVIGEERVVAMYFNNKAAEALSAGHSGEAYGWSRAAIEHDPLYAGAYTTLAVLYAHQRRPEQAERALRAALHLEPDNTHALNNLVSVLRAQGREAEASETASRLARLEPDTPLAAYKAGLAAFKSGHYGRAESLFKSALRGAPQDHEMHFMLSATYLRLGRKALAEEHLRQALAFSGDGGRRAAYAAKLARLTDAASPLRSEGRSTQ